MAPSWNKEAIVLTVNACVRRTFFLLILHSIALYQKAGSVVTSTHRRLRTALREDVFGTCATAITVYAPENHRVHEENAPLDQRIDLYKHSDSMFWLLILYVAKNVFRADVGILDTSKSHIMLLLNASTIAEISTCDDNKILVRGVPHAHPFELEHDDEVVVIKEEVSVPEWIVSALVKFPPPVGESASEGVADERDGDGWEINDDPLCDLMEIDADGDDGTDCVEWLDVTTYMETRLDSIVGAAQICASELIHMAVLSSKCKAACGNLDGAELVVVYKMPDESMMDEKVFRCQDVISFRASNRTVVN